MSLRAKLLLLSLLTLILPLAGWQYAEQMETALRRGQEQALITTAQVLSRVVASEPELLYRVPELHASFDAERGDLFAPLLEGPPQLDGFADEWPAPTRPVPGMQQPPRRLLGVFGRVMHLYFEVTDAARTRFEQPLAQERFPGAGADRVIVLIRDEFGRERAWSISAVAPGPLIVRPCQVGAPWRALPEEVPNVSGIWRSTATGYAIELRAPVNAFGTQLAVFALDPDADASAVQPSLSWLHTGSASLRERLAQYTPDGLRVSVVDTRGWLLARAGSPEVHPGVEYPDDEDSLLRAAYRGLLRSRDEVPPSYGLPYGMWGAPVDRARAGENAAIWFDAGGGEPSMVRAAVPVRLGSELLGVLVVEQPAAQLMRVREEALARLLNLTLVATLFAMAVTLVFAARLSHRIRRLSRAAATALTPEGRIEADIPETRARDEIGALARSYSALLARVQAYTSYLQTLGGKLSHELRTPLTIVSSSLENLASEARLADPADRYLERARSGTARMHALLTALTEATRVEQSIEQAERVAFDLDELVRNIGAAYRETFSAHRIEVLPVGAPCPMHGAPDLIAQMLDKLMDNAADFCPPGGRIALALEAGPRAYRLSVRNEGPSLPADLENRVFESLVSARTREAARDSRPHLGLGLYIVRLIVEFHRGAVTAANLPDGSGVEVCVELPRDE